MRLPDFIVMRNFSTVASMFGRQTKYRETRASYPFAMRLYQPVRRVMRAYEHSSRFRFRTEFVGLLFGGNRMPTSASMLLTTHCLHPGHRLRGGVGRLGRLDNAGSEGWFWRVSAGTTHHFNNGLEALLDACIGILMRGDEQIATFTSRSSLTARIPGWNSPLTLARP